MQMAACIAVCAVIQLVWMECGVDCFSGFGDIGKEEVPFFLADVDDFTDMILVSDNTSSGFALLFEKYQLADLQIADFYYDSI